MRIACVECDCEGDFRSTSDAELAGWTEIVEDSNDEDGAWWTALGYCPDDRPEWVPKQLTLFGSEAT